MCKLFDHQQQKLRTRKQFDFTFVICSYEINLIRLKAVIFGEGSAVGDQKVYTKCKLNFKYKRQTFWNTISGWKVIFIVSHAHPQSPPIGIYSFVKMQKGSDSAVTKFPEIISLTILSVPLTIKSDPRAILLFP